MIAALSAALLLASCGDGETAESAGEQEQGENLIPEEAGFFDSIFADGSAQLLGEQAVHENGSMLQLHSVQVKPTETILNVTLINGRDREVSFNRFGDGDNSFIVSGSGVKLVLSPPPDNMKLLVQPKQSMDAQLVFLGELPAGQQAQLVLNEGQSATGKFADSPGYRVTIPLSGEAFGDDGSKKKISRIASSRNIAMTNLSAATAGTSSSEASGVATSSLSPVEALQSDLSAEETDRGTLVSLPGDVLFDFDKATIRDSAKPTLDKLAELIKLQNPPSVAIEGHTDNRGSNAYNHKLSLARARSVEDYLVSKGVERGKLKSEGFGESKPVARNETPSGADDPDGRQKNRRVEAVLAKP